MKLTIFKLFIPFLFLISTISISQTSKSITIDNVSEELVWPAVYQTFKDLKLKYPLINKHTGIGKTNFFIYKTMLAKNRAKYKIIYTNSTLTISLINRQYLSKSRWVDNPLPMSKKRAAKILQPIKNKIIEFIKTKTITSLKNKSQTNIKDPKLNKAGVHEDYILLKTKDSEIDIIAFHKNGNILGFDLWEGNKTVKSLIFKETLDSKAITMVFDKNGLPDRMITSDYIINISSTGNQMAELTVYDLIGNPIGNKKIDFPYPKDTSIKIQEFKREHGPSSSTIFITVNEDYISFALSVAVTATKLVGCATGVATAVTGVGAVLAGVACTSLFLDVIVNDLPKEHYMHDELSLASEITSLASLPVLKSLNGVGKIVNLEQTVEIIGALISGIKNSYEKGKGILEKNPKKEINSVPIKNNETEVVIPVKSNASDKLAIITLIHEAINKITISEKKIKGLRKVANETNYQKIAIDIQNIEKNIEVIKTEYTKKIKNIAQKRTIRFSTQKTDLEGFYYNVSGAEVMGFRWGKYGGPSIELEIFFTPKRTILKVKQFNRELRFYQDLRQFSFSFEDGSKKPLKYALVINEKIRQERKVKTTLRIKHFEKDIKLLKFYKSNAKTTKIN